jgi:prepilin-type N-terminal cleavage/methylation domain-containing protein
MARTVERAPLRRSDSGFTLIEILVVVALIGIIAGMVVPQTSSMLGGYKLKGNGEALNNMVSLAKIRAAAQLTRARVRVDLAARTFQLQLWNRTTNQWVTEGGISQLSDGVSFGFAGIGTPPPNTQAAIGQSPVCIDEAGGNIAGTACLTFNSRGMPVANSVPPAGGVIGNNAFYITDGQAVYATTVTTTPFIKFWWSRNGQNVWVRQ